MNSFYQKEKKIIDLKYSIFPYIYIYIYILWGPIDPICSNCLGKGWAQYPVSYVQAA